MYEAYVTPCVKGYGPRTHWQRYEQSKLVSAATLLELRQALAKHYGSSWHNKKPMYCDLKNGKTIRTGWVVGMRMSEGGDKWLQQDWVSVRECKDVEL